MNRATTACETPTHGLRWQNHSVFHLCPRVLTNC